jgi:Restriction endonuclease fold toxin 7
VSADPLGIHVPGEADLNLYAYVRGQALKSVDPRGLQEAKVVSEKTTVIREESSFNYMQDGRLLTVARDKTVSISVDQRLVRTKPVTAPQSVARTEAGEGPTREEMGELLRDQPHLQGVFMNTPEGAPDYKGHAGRRAAAVEAGRLIGEIGLTAASLIPTGGVGEVPTVVKGLDLARKLGKAGEEAAGIVKNTERIASATKTAKYRIPDKLDHAARVIGEVKNVKSLSYTNQLKDFAAYAEKNKYAFELWVRPTTKLSGPLQKQVEAGKITLRLLE